MRLGARILAIAAVAAAATAFALQNGAVRVTVRLGFVTFRSVSLAATVLTAVLVGMLAVLLVGLRADLRTRRMLRRYREALRGTSEEP